MTYPDSLGLGGPCHTCGGTTDPADEHYPHEPGCGIDTDGWCHCSLTAHPDCCPTCNTPNGGTH